MKFKIKHEIKGRIRVRAIMKHMTAKEADLLEYALSNKEGITSVRVNERTADVVLCYKIDRATVLSYLRKCHVDEIEAPESYLAHSGRTTSIGISLLGQLFGAAQRNCLCRHQFVHALHLQQRFLIYGRV